MSDFSAFMKKNKTKKENAKHAFTKTLVDEKGQPLEWEVRHITSRENDEITAECTEEVPVKGKPNVFRSRVNGTKYARMLLAASIVTPDLNNKALQDSYGVAKPEDLLLELIDDPGEYNDALAFIQEFQGFADLNEEVETAKN